MPVALTIAGFDPSGGAGVVADIKTFTAFGCFATAAVTSLTFQNTTGVFGAAHQRGADVRAQMLRVLLVGATLGLMPWESMAPRLHARGPVFFGRTLAVDPTLGALPDVYRASAALAVTALADPFLLEDLNAGLLAPEQAVSQVRARGESLLVDAQSPADTGLATALLTAMVARE